MNTFTRDDLNLLLEKKVPGVCGYVSIYMPTFRSGSDMQQGPSRLKNMMRKAEEKLTGTGIKANEAAKMLSGVKNLLEDGFFWQNQADGLAVFLGPEFFRYYRLPVAFKELVVVGENFNVKPLFPLLTGDGRFYLLAISMNEIKMLQCTRYGYREIELPASVPASLAEAMKYDELQKSSQYHGHIAEAGAVGSVITSHGKSISQERKERLFRYFRDVDRGLHDILHDEDAPLLFSGVDYLFPIYKQANTYPRLLDTMVPGNPDKISVKDLQAKGWDLLKPVFGEAKALAMRKFEKKLGTGETSTDPKEIIQQSYYGKVETLFLDENHEQWGVFDRETGTAEFHKKAEPCDEDLLDFALTNTVKQKGSAYVLKKDEVPGMTVAAVLRR